jgi:hypothetical protein
MVDVIMLLWTALTSLFRLRVRLEVEILVLRQQINVLRRKSPKRFVFRTFDRLVFVGLYRLAPGIVDALAIVRPETVVRWHRSIEDGAHTIIWLATLPPTGPTGGFFRDCEPMPW